MNIILGKTWGKRLQGQIEKYQFDVGVIEDKPHREAVVSPLFGTPVIKAYAGGPVRPASRISSGKTVGQVLVENMQRLNINLLQRPFKENDSDILKFTQAFMKFALKRPGVSVKRVENLLQAIVRNPILRQEYGGNKSATADAKGFDRHLIDTGQMFKGIVARARRV